MDEPMSRDTKSCDATGRGPVRNPSFRGSENQGKGCSLSYGQVRGESPKDWEKEEGEKEK